MTKTMVENSWAENMGHFLYHLDPDTRKITRRLEKLQLRIMCVCVCVCVYEGKLKVHWLKSSYDDVISAVDDFFINGIQALKHFKRNV